MALDPSIALAYRAPQFDNPLARYGQIAQIQGAQNTNRLADLQYRQALQAETNRNELLKRIQGVDPSTPEGLQTVQNAYMSIGDVKGAMEIGDNALNTAKKRGEIQAQGLKAANDRFNAVSAAMAPFVNKPDLTHDDVFATLGRLESMGMVDRSLRSLIPMDATKLPGFVKQLAIESEQGRKALESILPKVAMTDVGGQIVPTNTNTLAGPVGPLAGAAPLAKTNTPGELLTDERTRSEGRLNRGVTIRGQDMTDTRARQTLEAGHTQVVTDAAGNVTIVNKSTGQSRPAVDETGNPLKGKQQPLTESQGNATGFGLRAATAADILSQLEENGTFGKLAGTKEGVRSSLESVPVLGNAAGKVVGAVGNLALSGPQQQYEQAQRDFATAVLRKESGASISQGEFDTVARQYFPRVGDSDAVLKQKAENRARAVEALRIQAGPGADKIPRPGQAATNAAKEPVRIKGDDGYNALKSGERYIGPDNVVRVKP